MQGRALPDFAEVGYSRKDRYVGMFYFLWLGEHGQSGPHDITQILKENPDALDQPSHPAWAPPVPFTIGASLCLAIISPMTDGYCANTHKC